MADKFFDKVKFFMGLGPYEDDEEYDEDDDQQESSGGYSQPTASSLYPSSKETITQQASAATPANKIVNFNKPAPSGSNMRVVCIEPKTFEDSKSIVDHLKAAKPVVLNIETIEHDLARKIFDFCSGALYALDGHIQPVSRGIFVLAPKNVDVSGDVKTELQNKGIFNFTNKE